MSFMSWLFGTESAEDKKKGTIKLKAEADAQRKNSTRVLIDSLKEADSVDSNGETQRFIRAELEAAAEADAKRVEQKREADEKVEEHRKRADTVMRQVAEKTCGLSDIVVRRKSGEYTKKKALTKEEQEEAKKRGLEHMREMGWRES